MNKHNSDNTTYQVKINGNNVGAMLKKKWIHEKLYE
jgi:hypothetical protein